MELSLGTGQVLGSDTLVRARVKRSIDPLFGYLQQDAMELEIRGGADLARAAQVQAYGQLYHQGQLVATQQVQACHRAGLGQQLQCRTNLDFLQLECKGGIYQEESAMGLLWELLGDRDIDMHMDSLGTVSGHIPICTRGQALRMLTFACGACLRVGPSGAFFMQRLASSDPVYIGPERVLGSVEATQLPVYSKVELVSHSYTPAQNPVTLFSAREFSDQEQTIRFQEPVHWLYLSQGVVLEQGPNFITFRPLDLETLQVKPYLHGTAWLSRELMAMSEHTRVLSVRDNTLVGDYNSARLLEQLCNRAQMRQQLQLRILVEEENVGDLVTVQTPWGDSCTGYITAMDSTYTPHSHVARITVMGRKGDI